MPAAISNRDDNGFFTDNWRMFSDGVYRLNPRDIRRLKDDYARQNLPPGYSNLINIPGWQDVIKLGAGPPLSREDFAEYFAALREGRAPDLDLATLNAIIDAVEQRRNMLGAADSEMAGSWGRMLNALDNVQDLTVTLGLFGWLAIWWAPTLFGRATPIVGSVLLVSDLLNLLTWAGQMMSPFYAALCKGTGAALAAAAPALAFGLSPKIPNARGLAWRNVPGIMSRRDGKGHIWKAAMTSGTSRYGRMYGGLGPFGKYQWISLAIQAPQVTTSLWGYGVALGGLVGVFTGGAAAGVRGLSGEPIDIRMGHGASDLWRMINRPLSEDPPADLLLLEQCAHWLALAPSFLRRSAYLSPEKFCAGLAITLEAQRVVYGRLRGYPWQDSVLKNSDEPLTLPSRPTIRGEPELEAAGVPIGTLLPWDMPGNPVAVRIPEYAAHVQPHLVESIRRFTARWRHTMWGTFAGTLVNQMTEETYRAWADVDRPIRWELQTDWALLASLVENGRLPITTVAQDRLWAFWQAARAESERRPLSKWTGATWDALADGQRIPLLRIMPPDAPWPDEWRQWFDARREQTTP